jgi:hypothetical protein
MTPFVPRMLSNFDGEKEIRSPASAILTNDRYLDKSLIILGEPGSGKSRLLAELARLDNPHGRPVTAQRLVRDAGAVPPDPDLVFVDALDELPELSEGNALHNVLSTLRKLRVRRFVLACRAAEWRAEAAKEIFKQWLDEDPVELFLVPLSVEEAEQFLAATEGLGPERALAIVRHYQERGLSEWLGNPLTLEMLSSVAANGDPPSSSSELFEQFVDLAWGEHRKQGPGYEALSQEQFLGGLGAFFAALILGGYGAISVAPAAKVAAEDLPFPDVRSLRGFPALPPEAIGRLLDTRLVVPLGNDRFTYMHRRLGEYLGARWLISQADTGRKRSRLMNLFRSTGGVVPASLRGLFGWLALDNHLAPAVIETDPLAVIEYGDADRLGPRQAELMLDSLADLGHRNDWWRSTDRLRATSLVRPAVQPKALRILEDPHENVALRLTVLEQLRDVGDLVAFRPLLAAFLLDPTVPFNLRDEAAEILFAREADIDWPVVIRQLAGTTIGSNLRLALDIAVQRRGQDLSDAELAKLVFDRHETAPDEVGKFWRLKRTLPDDRIDGVLDALSAEAKRRLSDRGRAETWDLQSLHADLLIRRLELNTPLEASTLWSWVSSFPRYSRTASRDDEISRLLAERDELRRGVQHYVLIEAGADRPFFDAFLRLRDWLPGCLLTDADLVHHLERLPEGDPRWWDLVTLARHDAERGQEVRAAAARHATDDEARQKLEELATPRKQPWEIEQEERERKRLAEREARWKGHREFFMKHRDRLRQGDWTALVGPADIYVGWATEEVDDLAPHERIQAWLVDDLAAEVFRGFEVWLKTSPLTPREISETYAEGKCLRAGSILLAALAERHRNGCELTDLRNDRLIAGMLEFELGPYIDKRLKALGEVLDRELRARGIYEDYARQLIEPQLRAGKPYPTGLYALMREDRNAEVAARLAAEWLQAIPWMDARAEEELIDCLRRVGKVDTLRVIAAERLAMSDLAAERRRNWQVTALISDFSQYHESLGPELAGDPTALWVFRARLGGRRNTDAAGLSDRPDLLAWIVDSYRAHWPNEPHPTGVTTGDSNPWDASEFLRGLINLLAEDTSDEAAAALRSLAGTEDRYASYVRRAIAQQADRRAELDFRPVGVGELAAALTDSPPRTPRDLQVVVLEALDEVQRRIVANETDSWRRFYRDPARLQPQDENSCSDYLKEQLEGVEPTVSFLREKHLASDREGDIWCSANGVSIPIEAKGQWNGKLWTAADEQLAKQQATDHRADGYGIYLVYWFGNAGKRLKAPPRGSSNGSTPSTPEELERALRAHSPALRSGRLAVKVLDLSRPGQ